MKKVIIEKGHTGIGGTWLRKAGALMLCLFLFAQAHASYIVIPMDEVQQNHLKAYGVAYWALQREAEVTWLLNYRGGAFMTKYAENFFGDYRGYLAGVRADG